MTKIPSRILAILAIIILGCLIYSNTFFSPFHFDDDKFIVYNANIKDLSNVGAIYRSLGHPSRFIAFTTFALNYHFHGLEVFGYHLVNLLIHVGNGLLLWWFILLLFKTPELSAQSFAARKDTWALLIALLFLTHPLQTQAVTYISQRFASLATLFYLGSICLYLRARLEKKGRIFFFSAALISAVAGMFTKQITFTLPLMITLIEISFLKHQISLKNKRVWVFAIGMMLLLLIIPLFYQFNISKVLLAEGRSRSNPDDIISWGNYVYTQIHVVVTYLRLFMIPLGQNLDYDYHIVQSLWTIATFCKFFIHGLILTIAWRVRRQHQLISFGLFWFYVALCVESLIPIPHVIFEHRMYLPSIGLCIAAVFTLATVSKKYPQMIVCLYLIIASLAVLTYERNKVWQSPITLWSDVVKKSPQKTRGYYNLGAMYLKKKEYAQALENFNKVIELRPKFQSTANAYHNRGMIYQKQNKAQLALNNYTQAIQLNPKSFMTYYNRGLLLKKHQQYPQALEDINQAIELKSSRDEFYITRAEILKIQKRYASSLADLNTALQLNPQLAKAYNNRANIYQLLGESQQAIDDYSSALKINPRLSAAYYNRANAFLARKEFKHAVADFKSAQALGIKNLEQLIVQLDQY